MTLTPPQEQFDYLVKLLTLIAGAITFIAIALKKKDIRAFAYVWSGALAGAGIVTGLAIVICAFDKSLVPVLADMSLYLGITGLSLVYLSAMSISDAWTDASRKEDSGAPKPGAPAAPAGSARSTK